MDTTKPLSEALSGDFVSRLCNAILEYWSFILQQESWSLRQSPGPWEPMGASDSLPSSAGGPNHDHTDSGGDLGKDGAASYGHSRSRSSADAKMEDLGFQGNSMKESRSGSWNKVRFLLNQERDRLYLWRSDFTQHDLDRLVSDKSNILGSAVLEALVSIGKALLDETEGVTFPGIQNSPREELNTLVLVGKELVKNVCCHDNDDDDDDIAGSVASNCLPYEPGRMGGTVFSMPADKRRVDSYQIVESGVARLQSLSFSIRQMLADMEN